MPIGPSNKQCVVVTDMSMRLILVELQGSSPLSPFKVSSRVLIANAKYKVHDAKLGLDIVSYQQSYTQVTTARGSSTSGWPGYAESAFQRLAALCSNTGQAGRPLENDSLGKLMTQANKLLTSMLPSL